QQLQSEGLLVSKDKSVYVQPPYMRMPVFFSNFDRYVEGQGLASVSDFLERPDLVSAPPEIAHLLGVSMKISETINHYLLNLENRRYSKYTRVGDRRALVVLAHLLAALLDVVELEQVTVLHLSRCVQHPLTTPVDEKRRCRSPESDSILLPRQFVSIFDMGRRFLPGVLMRS
ncbi:MAG TPA: hypothetical protein VFN35_28170, partial [Ktedonobacteraceae bacterium]|nr:hypothetical protein [Ktedonobacteraceae bacterium]